MALSVVDLYRDYLPKTNCRDCGFPTCLAFAGMVVSSRHPIGNCPHIPAPLAEKAAVELEAQYRQGKWVKKDLAEEALAWARERAASMALADLPGRIGGTLVEWNGKETLALPYFNRVVRITSEGLFDEMGNTPGRWEQVFLYNHLAQGGSSIPTGVLKGFKELPNTVSKMKTMISNVEEPIQNAYTGKTPDLVEALAAIGGQDVSSSYPSCDTAARLTPLPRVPVVLLFWDADRDEGYDAQTSLLFDETVLDHLDIESIIFLSETIKDLLVK